MTTSAIPETDAPELSVVMPSKNVGPWISEAVTSVLTQSVSSVELIVVDDGSDDDTLDVLASFDDPRLRVVRNPGSGGGTARNHGASLARGAYLAFADGDDLVPEHGYEALLAQARRTGAEMVIANYVIFSPTTLHQRHQWFPLYGRVREGITIRDEPILLRDRVCWNRVFLREAWDAAGIRFADAPRSNDIQAMTDAYCAFEFDVIPDPVYLYRRRAGGSSMTAKKSSPDSIVAHFAQELGCLASVRALQSERVFASYASEMLENDVWAHIGPLLDVTRISDPAYADARRVVAEFIRKTLAVGGARLDATRRAIYSLVASGDWAGAATVGSAATGDDRQRDAEDALHRLRRSGASRQDAALEALQAIFVGPLLSPSALSDEALVSLLRDARRFAAKHVPVWRRPRPVRHALAADPAAPAAEIRAHLSRVPPEPRAPLRAARHVLSDLRSAADLGARAARRAGDEARASAGSAARKLPRPLRRIGRSVLDRLRRR